MIIIKLITLFFIFFIYNSKIKRRDLNHGFKNQIESIKELKKDPIFGLICQSNSIFESEGLSKWFLRFKNFCQHLGATSFL